jgi:putative membrane protein
MISGGGYMVIGSLIMLLFWGGLIVLIVLAIRWFGGSSPRGKPQPGPGQSALDILEERFARGEIDAEELQERKRALSG